MQARDAAGRQVSLLNDDAHLKLCRPGRSPLPNTPELLRSDSYDSNSSGYDALSPLTPGGYDYMTHRPLYDDYMPEKPVLVERPSYVESSRSNSYEEDASSAVPERAGKRYPCRYRDSHGCEKTFTTSGHASRHSKIHTAEKAVQCTFPGCHKKFTRADNMKQHLETHFKDKSRTGSSKSSKGHISAPKRGSISSRSTSSVQSSAGGRDVPMWESDPYHCDSHPMSSTAAGAWDMRGLNHPLASRASAASSGLDALAAIACQEGP